MLETALSSHTPSRVAKQQLGNDFHPSVRSGYSHVVTLKMKTYVCQDALQKSHKYTPAVLVTNKITGVYAYTNLSRVDFNAEVYQVLFLMSKYNIVTKKAMKLTLTLILFHITATHSLSPAGLRTNTNIMEFQTQPSNWAAIPQAPADKILGLNEEYLKDPFTGKISLGVGAYRDDNGKPYVLNSVREARKCLEQNNMDHEYTGIAGIPAFLKQTLIFAYGVDAEVITSGRVAAVQSLSGTGACRLVGEFIAKFMGVGTPMYIPNPTWGNHLAIMKNAGLEVARYRYFNAATRGFDYDGMMADVLAAPEHSCFLLHACAHNPTGCDPTHAQWDELSAVMTQKKHVVIFDSAYQGFASGDSEEDAYSIRKFVADGHQVFLCQSYAKNFGLYGERVGALSVITGSPQETERVNSQLKVLVRAMYSSPPLYGARIVAEILSTPALRTMWAGECKGMAERIKEMRHALKSELSNQGSSLSWEHVTDQIGMFCFTGLSEEQVLKLRNEHHIYCTDDGRISIAGMNTKNVAIVAAALHSVTSK